MQSCRGFEGLAALVGFMALWTVLCLPLTPLEATAGMLYKLSTAVAVCVLGQLIGSIIAFLIGRYFMQELIYKHFVRR
jgi:uncharacterized membrane protein YdjX (TVP38/TMEM64 family)